MIYYFAALGLSNALLSFLAGLYVYLHNRSGSVHRSFFIWTITVALWSGFYAIWQVQTDQASALLFFRITMMPCYYIPFAFLWFVLTLTYSKPYKFFFHLCWSIPTFFLLFNFTRLGVKDVTQRLFFPFWPVPGLMIHIYFSFYCIDLIIAFSILFYFLFHSIGPKKQQIKWVVFTMVPTWLAGSTNWFLWYNIPIAPFPYVFVSILILVLAHGIVRRQLFDLEAIARAFQKEKLATIGLLTASVNHEIRNPLYAAQSMIINYLEDRKESLSRVNPEEMSEKVLRQIHRALDVITKLNRFSKPIDEKPTSQKCDILEVVRNVLDLVSYEFQFDKIKIDNQIPNNIPEVCTDQRQLEEILFNLIVNACHAMETGGTLTLRSTVQNLRIIIEIMDTGPGISEDQMKHLFEPFHTTKGEKGTGLGLYITKQLVERNGGRISVSSKPNQGTSFILEFKTESQGQF